MAGDWSEAFLWKGQLLRRQAGPRRSRCLLGVDAGAQQLRGPCWFRRATSSPAEPGPGPGGTSASRASRAGPWRQTVGLVFHPQGGHGAQTWKSLKRPSNSKRTNQGYAPAQHCSAAWLGPHRLVCVTPRRVPDAPHHLYFGQVTPQPRRVKLAWTARGTATFETWWPSGRLAPRLREQRD